MSVKSELLLYSQNFDFKVTNFECKGENFDFKVEIKKYVINDIRIRNRKYFKLLTLKWNISSLKS